MEANISAQIPQDQYIKVGNINTRFWAAGDAGTVVILIHCFGGSVEKWVLNINALAQRHRVYALDLAGFGRSDKVPMPTISSGAQFISDFMEVQHIDKTSLVGNSMGSLLALQFAMQFGDKVEKLVLANSGGLGREITWMLRLLTIPLIGELLSRPSRKGLARIWKECVYDKTLVTDEFIEQVYELACLPGAQKSLLSVARVGFNFRGQRTHVTRSIIDNLASIAAPTLVIWGKEDCILPVAHAQVAAARIPDSKLHIFDRCGHMPQIEHPEEFNKLVLDFLAG